MIHYLNGGATIETFDSDEGTLVRFTYRSQSVTGTLGELAQGVINVIGGPLVIPVDWLPMHGSDWVRNPDAEVVCVRADLDDAGRRQALAEAGIR